MSTSPKITEAKARKVQDKLSHEFNTAVVCGIGVLEDKEGYFVSVSLTREPTREEEDQLPKQRDGVRIKYEVTGPFTLDG